MHAVGLAAAAAALLAGAAVLPLDAAPLSLFACPLRAATGLPCLTCGCTHAFHYVVRLQLSEAFASSPLGAVLALVCFAHAFWTLLRLCGLPWAPHFSFTPRARWAALAALVANWAFLAVRA